MRRLFNAAIAGLGVAAFLTGSAAAQDFGIDAGHQLLSDRLSDAGVVIQYRARGDGHICKVAWGGYQSSHKRITVCLDKKTMKLDRNSFDTLRHEAIHAIQDCRGVRLGNNALKAALSIEQSYAVAGAYGVDLDRALTPYVLHGANEYVLTMEAEAILGAHSQSPEFLADQVRSVCESES